MASESRSRLKTAAAALFCTQGYQQTSLLDIGEASGVRAALVHYYWKTKEELLFEIMLDSAGGYGRALDAIAASSANGVEKLAAAIAMRVRLSVEDPVTAIGSQNDIINTILTPAHREEWVERRRRGSRVVRGFVEQAIEEGLVAVQDPDLTALAAIGMADGVRWWFRPEGPLTLEQVAARIARLALRLLSPQAG